MKEAERGEKTNKVRPNHRGDCKLAGGGTASGRLEADKEVALCQAGREEGREEG